MSKPWANTGLSDFTSWLGETVPRQGLIYRGDADFEQLGPGGRVTVVEFKQAGEKPVGRGQLAWLRHRAKQPRTEVRVVREVDGTDPDDPAREVWVWNPLHSPRTDSSYWSLADFKKWVDSRAYRVG